jgi:prepilin-type N-terminal cleavage/methylation domain-containing protein
MDRRGYTFIELLLVLAILAAIAGIAWPAVIRFTGERAIKDASEQVRAELDRTRFRAINSGLTYQFRYEPNGRRFLAVPAERDLVQTANAAAGAQTGLPAFSGEIADGLTLQPPPGVLPAGELLSTDWLVGLPDGIVLGQARWSAPIYYRPDGTATYDLFRVVDEQGRFIELSVRELTGAATSGPLRTEAGL